MTIERLVPIYEKWDVMPESMMLRDLDHQLIVLKASVGDWDFHIEGRVSVTVFGDSFRQEWVGSKGSILKDHIRVGLCQFPIGTKVKRAETYQTWILEQ